ncbi:MAG: GNAT family N-acetyltransferase, partial [Acidobacteriota bacterium]
MRSTLVVPARLEYLHPTAAYIRVLAETIGFEKDEVGFIELAAEEIFVNIVKHGFPDVSDGSFQLDLEVRAAELSLEFKAKGIPFDPERVPTYDPDSVRNGETPQGLGLFLARQAVDRIVFHNMGRGGYSIELVKMPGNRRIDRYPGVGEIRPVADEGRAAAKEVGEWTIRPLLPEEAIEISRCAYQAYGYSYEDYIYYPDRIIEANRDGYMLSLVAVTADGDIMGHIALKKRHPSDRIAEMGVLFIKPEYRQGGIALKLTTALMEKGSEMGLTGLYGRTVAGHTVSQKITYALGLKDCGILLGVFPSQVEFKTLAGTIQQKMSGLMQWIGLGAPRPRTIHLTGELVPLLNRIYAGLGLPLTCGAPPDGECSGVLPQSSKLSVVRDTVLDIATVEVAELGDDLLDHVHFQLRMLCLEKTPVIYLNLDAEHPALERFLPRL